MVSNTNNAELATKLSRLRRAYRSRLCDDLGEIETLAKSLSVTSDLNDILPVLRQKLHKLAGSAGTFGFHQLGARCRVLERQLHEWLCSSGETPGPELIQELVSNTSEVNTSLQMDESKAGSFAISKPAHQAEETNQILWLIERDAILSDYIAHQLRSLGYQIVCFSDPEDLPPSYEGLPQLILVDHRAGVSEAVDCPASYWREKLMGLPCPVIFIGGVEDFDSRLEAVRVGARGYFVKPLDIPRLAARISFLINNEQKPAERVLLVSDDQATLRQLFTSLSQAGMEVDTLESPQALLHRAAAFQPELLILDVQKWNVSSPELGEVLRQVDKWSNLPIFYLNRGQNSAGMIEQMLATDGEILSLTEVEDVLALICRSRIKRKRKMEAALSRDSLTGLLKHRAIKEALAEEISAGRRAGTILSVVMLDIDHFKSVNDTHGHALGDVVINTVGTLLQQHFRSTDRVGRYGGEEFLVIMPDCDVKAARIVMEKLLGAFSEISFVGSERAFSCTLSAGISDNTVDPDLTAEQLLVQADGALYEAKQSGRNRVCVAGGETP